MTALDGVKITFPDNDIGDLGLGKDLVFRTQTASVSHRHESSALSAGSNIIGLVTEWTDAGAAVQNDGRSQQARVDLGGGVHITSVRLSSWEGSQHRWGADDGSDWDAGGDPPLTQLSVLNEALRSIPVDSVEGSITLEVGEYHTGGRFDPLEVAPVQPSLSFDVDSQSSSFGAELEFVDIVDLEQASDALLREDE